MMRKVRSTANGVCRTKIHETASTSTSARKKPMAGDMKIAAPVFKRPPQTIDENPTLASPAPTRPPISACEELEGMPKTQVMMFHRMAPIRAAKITCGETMWGSMMPVPSVSATCRPKNMKAMKLKKAAQATAYCGRSTRVETMVAMEFAASCRPLRKSKNSAMPIRPASSGKAREASIRRSRSRCR